MNIIMALLLEVIINGSNIRDAIILCTDIPNSEIPDFNELGKDVYQKISMMLDFTVNHKQQLGLRGTECEQLEKIDIKDLVDMINNINVDSNSWSSANDVFNSLKNLGLLPSDFIVPSDDGSYDVMKNFGGETVLMEEFNKGLNVGLKQLPVTYRAIAKNKILKMLK